MKILIDAGHRNNKYDFGTCYNGLRESGIALQISKKLKIALEERSIECYMSRNNEQETIELCERTNKAKNLKVDLLISIHINSSKENLQAKGIEVLYRNNKELAKNICDSMCEVTGAKNRGAKLRNDLFILNGFENSIIIECGFLSNKLESTLLVDSKYQDRIVHAILETIVKSYKILEQDTELISAVDKLVEKGVNIDPLAWSKVDKMDMKWGEELIKKLAVKLNPECSCYYSALNALIKNGVITDRTLWDKKEFVPKYIRTIIIRIAKLI